MTNKQLEQLWKERLEGHSIDKNVIINTISQQTKMARWDVINHVERMVYTLDYLSEEKLYYLFDELEDASLEVGEYFKLFAMHSFDETVLELLTNYVFFGIPYDSAYLFDMQSIISLCHALGERNVRVTLPTTHEPICVEDLDHIIDQVCGKPIEVVRWVGENWFKSFPKGLITLGLNPEFGFITNAEDFEDKMTILTDLYHMDFLNSCVGCHKAGECDAQHNIEDAQECINLDDNEEELIKKVGMVHDFIESYTHRMDEYNELSKEEIKDAFSWHEENIGNPNKKKETKDLLSWEVAYEVYDDLLSCDKEEFLKRVISDLINC